MLQKSFTHILPGFVGFMAKPHFAILFNISRLFTTKEAQPTLVLKTV
jgi:hypothetical protein